MPVASRHQQLRPPSFIERITGAVKDFFWGFVWAVVLKLPVWVYPGINCTSFSPAAYIALPAVGVTATIVTFKVPKGQNGVIYEIANVCQSAQFIDGSGSVTWAIAIDDHFAKNYQPPITCQLGLTTAPRRLSGPIFVKENQQVSLQVTNVSLTVGPGAQAGGLLGGWFYPKDEEPEDAWAN